MGSRRGRGLSPEEAALWRRVQASVRPLRPVEAAPLVVRPESPLETPAAPVIRKKPKKETAPAPAPVRVARPVAPADRSAERKVRRGQLDVIGSLDLPGHTQDQARAALFGFLRARQGFEACVVLVVTGKGGRLGAGDAAPGVLKRRFPEWLAEPAIREIVAGFAPAHQRHGGGGAFYVFLKRRMEN